jgi:hypothetical protein
MNLFAIAILNGVLVAGLLVALTYVCRIPYRLDRLEPSGRTGRAVRLPEQHQAEDRAA